MPYVGKKPADIIATAVDTTTGTFSSNATVGGTLGVTGETTLSANLNLGDNDKAIFGAGSGDLEIYSDGTYSRIMETGGLFLVVDTNGSQISLTADNSKNMGSFIKDGAVQLFYSNAQKFSTTSSGIQVTGNIANTSGDFTLDVAGNILLDADDGNIHFKDGGTGFVSIINSSGDAIIQGGVQDKDIIFKGNDGGGVITALTLNMSDGGTAQFNNKIQCNSINTGSSTGTLTMFGGGTNKGGTIELSGGNNTGSTGSGIVFKTGASTSSPSEKMRIDQYGHVTMPNQPAFYVETSSTQTDFGLSSTHVLAFGTERFDQNADFASNVFTAPVTGRYFLHTTLRFESLDTAATYYLWGFDTSNNDYLSILDPNFSSDLSYISVQQTVLADMDAGDTAKVVFQQVGGTQQTDLQGAGGYSYFCGNLVA